MPILLLSSGFSSKKILDRVELIVKNKLYKKAVIVTTAHPKKEKSIWAEATKRQLKTMGLSVYFVDFEVENKIDDDIDLVYVCGGNTFRLINFARDAKFNKIIEKILEKDGMYIGSSAGAVIASPTIDVANEIDRDKNIFRLTNLSGLGIVDFHIIPHYRNSLSEKVEFFKKKHSEDVYKLRDGEGILIEGDELFKV